MGLRFTFKSRNIDDNSMFHFNFLFICYNIHLLIINNHLSLAFKFLSWTCHPTKKNTQILKQQSTKKKTKNKSLNLPNNNDCNHYPRTSSSLKQIIANNILKWIVTYFFKLVATFLYKNNNLKQVELQI